MKTPIKYLRNLWFLSSITTAMHKEGEVTIKTPSSITASKEEIQTQLKNICQNYTLMNSRFPAFEAYLQKGELNKAREYLEEAALLLQVVALQLEEMRSSPYLNLSEKEKSQLDKIIHEFKEKQDLLKIKVLPFLSRQVRDQLRLAHTPYSPISPPWEFEKFLQAGEVAKAKIYLEEAYKNLQNLEINLKCIKSLSSLNPLEVYELEKIDKMFRQQKSLLAAQ